jgi:putative SOS response-associated peptidase YedK
MCGRFTLRTPARDLVEIFELLRQPELVPRFNIAPTQQVLVVRPDKRAREWTSMRWGLVPSWARDAPRFALGGWNDGMSDEPKNAGVGC